MLQVNVQTIFSVLKLTLAPPQMVPDQIFAVISLLSLLLHCSFSNQQHENVLCNVLDRVHTIWSSLRYTIMKGHFHEWINALAACMLGNGTSTCFGK